MSNDELTHVYDLIRVSVYNTHPSEPPNSTAPRGTRGRSAQCVKRTTSKMARACAKLVRAVASRRKLSPHQSSSWRTARALWHWLAWYAFVSARVPEGRACSSALCARMRLYMHIGASLCRFVVECGHVHAQALPPNLLIFVIHSRPTSTASRRGRSQAIMGRQTNTSTGPGPRRKR